MLLGFILKVNVTSVQQIGLVSRLVRKSQNLDQITTAAFSGNGLSFVSQFENGKKTVELGRVFEIFEALGIEMVLDLPLVEGELNEKQVEVLRCLKGE